METKPLKIISLTAENIKKLVAIEIVPKGNMVQLNGKNGSGKSSALDSISWAFEGLAKIQDKPIRMGQNKGWIRIDLGDYIIERTFKNTDKGDVTSSLTVMSADGAKFDSPQTLLNKLFGALSFDPLAFSQADVKAQVSMLESLVKDFDFNKSRADEKTAYDERTIVNRKKQESSLLHVSFKDLPVAEPERVDVKDLTERMAKAASKNADIEKTRAENEKKRVHFEQNRKSNEYLKTEADKTFKEAEKVYAEAVRVFEAAQEKHKQASDSYAKNEKDCLQEEEAWKNLPALPILEDVSLIKTELDSAQSKNDLHEKWKKKDQAKKDIDEYEKQSQALTDKITDIQKLRFNAVANAGIPISGLGFDETGVILNGVPFAQASDAEKLRTSVAIAMAANPTLRVIRVRDGSLLDEDGMALLAQMADEKDCQVWVERVGSGTVGFELIDGSLKQ